MGRPRKVIKMKTGHTSKEFNQNRINSEQKYKLGRDELVPPAWLDQDAKDEFERIVKNAASVDFLDNLDLNILAAYCNAWSRYTKLCEVIQELDGKATKLGEVGVRIPAKGVPYETNSPYASAMDTYYQQMLKASTKLGLATTDRLKLMAPEKSQQKENKFAKFLREA